MLGIKRVYQKAELGNLSETHQSTSYLMLVALPQYRLVSCVVDNVLIDARQQKSVSDSRL